MIRPFVAVGFVAALAACAPVHVQPDLNSSLGYSTFAAMGKIDPLPVPIAVYLSPQLVDLTLQTRIMHGSFTFAAGKALSAKLLKALSYEFRTIYIADTMEAARAEPVKAILILTPGSVESHFGFQRGFVNVGATAFLRLPVRAELMDARSGRITWIGTSQAQEHTDYQEVGKMRYQEAGAGFATAVNAVIDQTVGNLVHQLEESPRVAAYAEGSA